jgi:hypothetical protein
MLSNQHANQYWHPSFERTTELILQLLHMLVSTQQGACAFTTSQLDLSPLTEIAPEHPIVLEILRYAWLNHGMAAEDGDQASVKSQVEETLPMLVSSFKTTDAVTLLEFLGKLLRQMRRTMLPGQAPWLETVVGYIQKLVVSRPNAEARSAYTNAAASLLKAYPRDAPQLLFRQSKSEERPFSYLLVNLLLIDIRSSAPTLLAKLNSPEYPDLSLRLSSAFDFITIFLGHLIRSLEDETLETLVMSPDNLLKLRTGIAETMSVTVEFLRDRWDGSVAGAMGLHPDARASAAQTSMGSRLTLTWESVEDGVRVYYDPLITSAVRALALWLREDDSDVLRKEATGLTDMLLDLFDAKSPDGLFDFRSPVLVAFEALCTLELGREMFLNHNGWQILTRDLTRIIQTRSYDLPSAINNDSDCSRGIEIVRVLLSVVEQERGATTEPWMDLITAAAAWNLPVSLSVSAGQEFEVAVLQLCCEILVKAHTGMRSRFAHTIDALAGVANQMSERASQPMEGELGEAMADVVDTLAKLAKA